MRSARRPLFASPRATGQSSGWLPGRLLRGLSFGLCVAASSLLAVAAQAVTTAPTAFTLGIGASDFSRADVIPEFGGVRSFNFEFELFGSLAPGQRFGNSNIEQVNYLVAGRLNLNPPTPSGFSAFALNRFAAGEGPISALDWREQRSSLHFEIAGDADLTDGLQLSDLVPNDKSGALLSIDARERGRLDVARYHPPQMLLFPDGTGFLRSSENSSEKTGTVNPATRLEVNLNFGDEYITRLRFDPTALTLVEASDIPAIPEPGTALLMGLGLAGLAARRGKAA